MELQPVEAARGGLGCSSRLIALFAPTFPNLQSRHGPEEIDATLSNGDSDAAHHQHRLCPIAVCRHKSGRAVYPASTAGRRDWPPGAAAPACSARDAAGCWGIATYNPGRASPDRSVAVSGDVSCGSAQRHSGAEAYRQRGRLLDRAWFDARFADHCGKARWRVHGLPGGRGRPGCCGRTDDGLDRRPAQGRCWERPDGTGPATRATQLLPA